MRRRITLVLTMLPALAQSGCPAASSAAAMTTPNGRPGYAVECGTAVSDECHEEAHDRCPKGYDVIARYDAGYRSKMFVECH
ncbi:MAG: hypothetical protein ACLP1X_31040 [Polyangiaceae bacterium]|jgi:hypothetical protein